jgi:hypothetical protein
MTLNVTVPDTVYRQIAELAARQQVSMERIVAAALAEQLSGWSRLERMAELAWIFAANSQLTFSGGRAA